MLLLKTGLNMLSSCIILFSKPNVGPSKEIIMFRNYGFMFIFVAVIPDVSDGMHVVFLSINWFGWQGTSLIVQFMSMQTVAQELIHLSDLNA